MAVGVRRGQGMGVAVVVSAGREGLLVDGCVRRGSSGDGARLGGYLLSGEIDRRLAENLCISTHIW